MKPWYTDGTARPWCRIAALLVLGVAMAGCASSSSSEPDASPDLGIAGEDAAPAQDQGQGLDCAGACTKASDLCLDLGSLWIDVCTTSCGNKQKIKPELATTEIACIEAASDCTTATLCARDI